MDIIQLTVRFATRKLYLIEQALGFRISEPGAFLSLDRLDSPFVLVQESQPKVHGLWNLPAGHVDKGESIETTAVREVKEETGYAVKLEGKIGIYHETVESPVRHAFTAKIIGGELKVQPDEILDAGWFSFGEITSMKQAGKLRVDWIYDAIRRVDLLRV